VIYYDAAEREGTVIRSIVPFLATLAFVIVVVLPIRLPGLSDVTPALPLIGVYFWALNRPEGIPEPLAQMLVFMIGLFEDLLSGGIVGLNAVSLLAVFVGVASQGRFFHGKSFIVTWWGFMLVAGLASLGWWLVTCGLNGTLVNPLPVLFQYLLTVFLYPAVSWILFQLQRPFRAMG